MHGTTMPYMTGRMLIGGELVESKRRRLARIHQPGR